MICPVRRQAIFDAWWPEAAAQINARCAPRPSVMLRIVFLHSGESESLLVGASVADAPWSELKRFLERRFGQAVLRVERAAQALDRSAAA